MGVPRANRPRRLSQESSTSGVAGQDLTVVSTTSVTRRPASDHEALAALVVEKRLPLVGFFYNQLGDEPLAEDLAQDVLASALAHLDEIDPQRHLWPWLLTIARNRLIDHHRRANTARDFDEDPRVLEALGPTRSSCMLTDLDDPSTRLEEHQLLTLAMRELPGQQRSALLLHDVHGWSANEIAVLHGRNRNAVHQLIHRARSRVRDEYQRLSGDTGPLGLLPWPVIWVSGLLRRTTARTRRGIQEWQLALPAFGESMASVAIVASLGLGAGTMWASDIADAGENPNLTDLSEAALAASAEAAAPQLAPPEPTTSTEEGDLGEHQRLAAAISDAEPDAFEAHQAVRAAEETELANDSTAEADEPSLPEATGSVPTTEANADPGIETSESQHVEDGIRVQPKANAEVKAGDIGVEDEGERYVEVKCVGAAETDLCDAGLPRSEPLEQSNENTASAGDETVSESDSDDSRSSTEEYAEDSQEYVSERQDDAGSLEDTANYDYCDSDDIIGTVCETAPSGA